jgi:hypothetical protein
MFWFARKKTPSKEPLIVSPVNAAAPAIPVVQSDLVKLALKEVVRTYGVPTHWVICEVIPLDAPSGTLRFQLILTMTKWNEQLLRYTLTLQQKLLHSLGKYPPKSERTEYQVSWAFAPTCNSPILEIPSSANWVEPKPAGDGLGTLFDRRKTLRPASRSNQTFGCTEFAKHDNGDQDGEDFAKTSITPLR